MDPHEGEPVSNGADAPQPFFSGACGDSAVSSGGAGLGPVGQIGPFRLLRLLGEGGYGIVYLAEQETPLRRRAAVKVIKPGMDSRQVIARFETERQTLALLDHPNIAHVYDAGTTPEGRPYFAMEYIEGLPITQYCDGERLGLRDRLQLFLQVCDAIQHAHQKGIIHRDLKPSNILVTVRADKPLIKVIDFGIAKALSQPLTAQTLHTEQGQFIGTPDYMSPEQAEMDASGVDTRSDVYALGVVLYELLTGVPPFDPEALRAQGPDHVRTVIREQEPKTPSTRLTNLGENARTIAERRRTDRQALASSLRRELEWIPLRAIRKDSARRYQSVLEFAHDIENYLRGRPLLAGPESTIYRIRKFVHRHGGVVATTASIVLLLVTGFIISTAMYLRAERMRVLADQSREVAQAAQAAETTHRQAAEQERDRAVRAEAEAAQRLVDLYQEQGRRYMELGDLDRALVLLVEALKHDGNRLATRLLIEECLRAHPDPNLHRMRSLIPWEGEPPVRNFSFATSPDRRLIALVNEGDAAVRVFDTTTARLKSRLHTGQVSKLAFVPGNQYLLAQTREGPSHDSISVFDLNTGDRITSIRRANADIDKLMTCPHGTLPPRGNIERAYNNILVGRNGGWFAFLDTNDLGDKPESWVVLWDFVDRRLYTSSRHAFDSLLISLGFRTASGYGAIPALIAVDCRQMCYLWNVPEFAPMEGFYFAAFDAIISDTRFAIQTLDGSLILMDRHDNRGMRTIAGIVSYGFSPDQERLVTQTLSGPVSAAADGDGSTLVRVWDTREGALVARLGGAAIQNWHFSPDSRFLISEHADGEIRVWFAANGRPVFAIPPAARQKVADISPDSGWLATREAENGSPVGIWNLMTGERCRPYLIDRSSLDLGAGWTIRENDLIFSCSGNAPGTLPQFNATGTALMCGQGLLPFHCEASQVVEIKTNVAAHVHLRIENGRIRPALQEEIWRARLDYCRGMGTQRNREAIDCLLNLASHAMRQSDLEEASTLLRRCLAILPTDDTELTERGGSLADELSGEYFRQADRAERCGRYDEAIEDYRHALRAQKDDPQTLRRLAWLLATCPDRRLRDTAAAVANAERACILTNAGCWECLHAYAVACAADGRFADAVPAQKKAIELIPVSEQVRWLGNLRTCLELFRSNQPYDRRHFWNLPERNLLCWWTFDDMEGTTVRDRSGRGHDAELSGEVHRLTDNGHAVLQFRGAEDSVRCPNTPELNVRDAVTVAAWVKYAPAQAKDWRNQEVAGKGHAWTLRVRQETGRPVFECLGLDVPASSPHCEVAGKTSLDDNRWHHLVGVYDGRALALYLDGSLDATTDASGSIIVQPQGVSLGKGVWNCHPWQGFIREARIYDRALRADEIACLYEETK